METKLRRQLFRNTVTQSKIPNNMEAARAAAEQVLADIASQGYGEQDTFAVRLALEEALTNAVKHGNRRNPSKSILLDYTVNHDKIQISISDQGEGFNPGEIPDPTLEENLERPCGRGIMLMKAYMDNVRFSECGNSVTMVRNRH